MQNLRNNMKGTISEKVQQPIANSQQPELKYCYKYPHPAMTADCVIFGFDGIDIKVLLIQRGIDPYKGKWAFPGGFMNMDETAEQCARRELEEETGLKDVTVEQFYTFSDVNRDPRERVVTVAHYALVKLSEVKGSDDAVNAKWFIVNEIPELAFDHEFMLQKAIQTIQEKILSNSKDLDKIMSSFNDKEKELIFNTIINLK